jgi:hypothetical protein
LVPSPVFFVITWRCISCKARVTRHTDSYVGLVVVTLSHSLSVIQDWMSGNGSHDQSSGSCVDTGVDVNGEEEIMFLVAANLNPNP